MSNHIDHIEITNFKSIRHQKIEGCKRVNVFIGYPNVGKSAILEAMSTLSYLQINYRENITKLCRLKHANELFYNANVKENARVIFSDDVDVFFNYLNESSFSLYVEIISEERIKAAVSPWERLRIITYSDNKVVKDDTGDEPYSKTILDRIKSFPIIKKYTFNFSTATNEHKTNALLLFAPYGENLVDVIQSNKDIRKEVSELFKSYGLKLLIDPATNSIRGLKQLDEETIFTIPFYQMADTLQRLIFHKAAIMSNENTVLLFEEPEAHMFPPYIKKFTGDIIFNKENGNQYFISTHSPFVLDDLIEDAREDLSVYLVGLKNGETIIKRLTDEELEEVHKLHVDLFFNIESYLD